LIEQYAGDFPLWLAPEQVRILPVSDPFVPYARRVQERLLAQGWRVQVDASGERLPKKIRTAETSKIPFMVVVGEQEQSQETVSVRSRHGGDQGSLSLPDFLALLAQNR